MNKIKCLIVDDESIAQRILEGYLNDLPEFELVQKCKNALEALEVLEHQKVDLMFLDIEMPKIKGLSFLRILKQAPAVIITSAYREYALEGYELEVMDYLLKPISFERFLKAINLYKKLYTQPITSPPQINIQPDLYVKSNRKTVKLSTDQILYIEGMNNYIKIHLPIEVHVVYDSLASILNRLPNNFFRIHKSYIINHRHILAFTKEYIEIGDQQLPIGNAYQSGVFQRLGNYDV